jgi:RNA polymerase sigma-70 factor (ECF subfamily)
VRHDEGVVNESARATAADLIGIFDPGLDEVYGYLLHRCGHVQTAQDLASETFLAAARAVQAGTDADVTVAWLVGIARHKLLDQWRKGAREERALRAVEVVSVEDPWPARLNELRAVEVLQCLALAHRMVLTLRYIDDLPVREVASLIGRSESATEALLVRARAAFRVAYLEGDDSVA